MGMHPLVAHAVAMLLLQTGLDLFVTAKPLRASQTLFKFSLRCLGDLADLAWGKVPLQQATDAILLVFGQPTLQGGPTPAQDVGRLSDGLSLAAFEQIQQLDAFFVADLSLLVHQGFEVFYCFLNHDSTDPGHRFLLVS